MAILLLLPEEPFREALGKIDKLRAAARKFLSAEKHPERFQGVSDGILEILGLTRPVVAVEAEPAAAGTT